MFENSRLYMNCQKSRKIPIFSQNFGKMLTLVNIFYRILDFSLQFKKFQSLEKLELCRNIRIILILVKKIEKCRLYINHRNFSKNLDLSQNFSKISILVKISGNSRFYE